MRPPRESKKLLLFCALGCSLFCLLYVVAAVRMGFWVLLQRPSPMFHLILFPVLFLLGGLCWYRWLTFRPERETREEERRRSFGFAAGMAVFSAVTGLLALGLAWMGLGKELGACGVFLLVCAVIQAVRAGKAKR